MYDVQRESGKEYLDHYIYKSRNECNQIIVCEVYRTYNETLNFAFYVTTKRKHGYQEGKTTGKDGIKSLLWAKKCLLDFIMLNGNSQETLLRFILTMRGEERYMNMLYFHWDSK